MNKRNTYVLTQYQTGGKYRNFLGHLYHFPKSYIHNFKELPLEFIFYEPIKNGRGEYFGCGEIHQVVPDHETKDSYFAVIKNYQNFKCPVPYRDKDGALVEGTSPHYNPQNAVRKMPSSLYDEISLDGGIQLNFKSDSHLIKVLGEQLIGSERVGVLELIKNAIDAQATYCRIRIEKINGLKNSEYEFSSYDGPVIVVEDDGIGMTKATLENGWLRPASTIKTTIKERIKKEREEAKVSGNLGTYDALIKQLKKEHGNRIPLGEKGVGRFATHRLGRFLELKTKAQEKPYELVLKIEWDKFDVISDKAIDLDSIGISITKQNPSRDYGDKDSGTQLIIYGGRDGFTWDEKSIVDLNRAILSLNSPNLIDPKKWINKKSNYEHFNAFLECPQIENLRKDRIYEESKPNFSFDVLVNEDGIADYSLEFKHPRDKIPPESWREDNKNLRILDKDDSKFWLTNGVKRKPECGAFFIHMDIWYRKREWIDLSKWKELTEYLGEFGGMSIYRDNILIFDTKLGAEIDWLDLTEQRIKQSFKLSYRDFIGSVEIEQRENIYLVDKTNREGLINNQAFSDLATLTKNAIDTILFPRYKGKRDEYNKLTKGIITDPKKLKEIAGVNSKFISNITQSNYPFDDDPYTFFTGLWEKAEDRKGALANLEGSVKELQKSIEMLEEVQNQFIEQAGFGIAVAISLHEINKITSNFYHSILHLLKSGQFDKFKLEELKDTSQSLQTELKRLGPLRTIRNERRIEFDIHRSINYASEVFKRRLKAKSIDFEVINPDDTFNIYGRYSALNQVFGNLFDNSIYWVENVNKSESKIIIKFDKKYRSVIFADSGNDIDEIIRPYLFEPGYSLKIPQSGLGLYICKTYLDSMKAKIYETPLRDRISDAPGAQFTLDFGRTPANKENL